jgi:hypothetical protein
MENRLRIALHELRMITAPCVRNCPKAVSSLLVWTFVPSHTVLPRLGLALLGQLPLWLPWSLWVVWLPCPLRKAGLVMNWSRYLVY